MIATTERESIRVKAKKINHEKTIVLFDLDGCERIEKVLFLFFILIFRNLHCRSCVFEGKRNTVITRIGDSNTGKT